MAKNQKNYKRNTIKFAVKIALIFSAKRNENQCNFTADFNVFLL